MKYHDITKSSGSVRSNEDLPIHYDFYVPLDEEKQQFPVIIFLHGFKGFKDWGAFPVACAELSAAGFAVLAMNFSLNGVGENMLEFDQLDLFARETLSQDLEDVGSIIAALKDEAISPEKATVTEDNIGILGHSRGGHTAVAAAAEFPEIKCLVTWSAVADYNARWSDEMITDWNEQGITRIKNGRTGQMMPVKDVVYKDALENADRLMAAKRVHELNIPAMFIHSKGDEAVPYQDAESLYQSCASDDKELILIPDSGHTFDVSHPFEGEFPAPFKEVVEHTQKWFSQHLQ
ncbi:MAG TPA: alpha/beta fold hydrolase [Balneolaceae bacterium]|nr:alpha/beta fold hydrolase [Balneolaceae bacterium]